MSAGLYERMKARGADLRWYERGKQNRGESAAIPLDDEECSLGSIYQLKTDGSLWTLSLEWEKVAEPEPHMELISAKPYKEVRPASKPLPRAVFVCVCCKKQWRDMPMEHIAGDSIR